jgi:hypothetical protein
LCPCVHLQVPDSAIPHPIITYLRVSLGRLTVKIPTMQPPDGNRNW